MQQTIRQSVIIATTAFAAACAATPSVNYRAKPADPAFLIQAVHDINSVIVYDILNPPQASRVYAYASIAAYEAARPGDPAQRTLAGQLNGLTALPEPDRDVPYYFPLASVHAFLTVSRALIFSRDRVDSIRVALEDQMHSLGIPQSVFDRSLTYGDRVAQHILSWAAQDHYLETRGYPKFTLTNETGRWQPTPPAYMDALEPHWAAVRSFTLDSAGQFRAEPPFRFDMRRGSPFFRDAREVLDIGRRLSAEQRRIVLHWDDNPYVMHVQGHRMFATKKVTPGGHWMGIVGIAARRSGADFMRTAEAYARAAIALADGFISCWEEKYRSNVVRPETVINAYFDARWQPMLQSPPFPEYTSGHSVISRAVSVVLTDQFGEAFAFTDSVETEFGMPPRSFASFEQAAIEAGMSRLYGGIHYRRAVEQGLAQGKRVGEHVVRKVRTRASATQTASS